MKYLKDLKKGNKVTVILPDNKIITCIIDHRSVVDNAVFIGIESTEVNGKVFTNPHFKIKNSIKQPKYLVHSKD